MNKVYIGLDVSMNSTGWAVLSYDGSSISYLDSGIIKANTKVSHGKRMRNQREKISEVVEKYQPQYVARESGFSRHIKSTQILFKIYGVVEELFATYDLVEIAPTTIKKLVTGSGRADKDVVEVCVREKVSFPEGFEFKSDDESDAVAIALALIEQIGGN